MAPKTYGEAQKLSLGKLVNRYRRVRRNKVKKKRKLNAELATDGQSTLPDENNDDLLEHVVWLSYYQEPWDEVVYHWKASRLLRTNISCSVEKLVQKWPVLSQQKSYLLVRNKDSTLLFRVFLKKCKIIKTKLDKK